MEMFYTKQHEWIKVEGGVGTVGITGHAVQQLGDITFVELPAVGSQVRQFAVLCGIESVKAASDIYAPVSGKVAAVNEALAEHPEIVNEGAEEQGWIARIELADPGETASLLTRELYDSYVEESE